MEEKDVKDVLDDFENDNFVGAKEKLKGMIKTAKETYLKNKLGLTKDISPKPAATPKPEEKPKK